MRIWRDYPDQSDFRVTLDGEDVRATVADDEEGWVIIAGVKYYGKVGIRKIVVPCPTCERNR